MSFLKTESFSEGLKPGDKIQNVNDGRHAEIVKSYGGGWIIKYSVGEESRHQIMSHEVINVAWVEVLK